mmetsp:Transcript_1568/g.4756  ORF Transcript_1568/g.4756 Transcript_1568/m.4756 type:complete len:208 (-) Transcript_1568:370-993(-)
MSLGSSSDQARRPLLGTLFGVLGTATRRPKRSRKRARGGPLAPLGVSTASSEHWRFTGAGAAAAEGAGAAAKGAGGGLQTSGSLASWRSAGTSTTGRAESNLPLPCAAAACEEPRQAATCPVPCAAAACAEPCATAACPMPCAAAACAEPCPAPACPEASPGPGRRMTWLVQLDAPADTARRGWFAGSLSGPRATAGTSAELPRLAP